MAFANGTSITTPNGTSKIEQLTPGDTALAWTINGIVSKPVVFSSGTQPGTPSDDVIHLQFGDETLIVTRDQPMILAGNKVKKAVKLTPGRDQLLKADGQSVMLDHIALIRYNGGLHTIAIDIFDRSGDHLIVANGIICGDYVMEMMPSPTDDDDDAPFLGVEEYKDEK